MCFARSGNSSGDELPAPGDYRQTNQREKVSCSVCYRGGDGYTGGVFLLGVFSDQLSCINYFNLTYGLKDIEFQSLNHF